MAPSYRVRAWPGSLAARHGRRPSRFLAPVVASAHVGARRRRMKIPYGISDFGQIRAEGFFYADKTPFLPVLEAGYRYLVFLRPRRFGKSTLVSMLEHYYDLGRRDRFDARFGGLWVHQHPTGEQSSYLVLTLDFSSVATDRGE